MTKLDLQRHIALINRRAAMWQHELLTLDTEPPDAEYPPSRLARIHEDIARAIDPIAGEVRAGAG